MLFLPAVSRHGMMRIIAPELKKKGLTVRGAYGEGSETEGDLFQISNEMTLGLTEGEIIAIVGEAVYRIVEMELAERDQMKREEGSALMDTVFRSYGILTNCIRIDAKEFNSRMADIKLGVALGYFDGSIEELNDLVTAMRPASINRLNGSPLDAAGRDLYRAEYAGRVLRANALVTEIRRKELFEGERTAR